MSKVFAVALLVLLVSTVGVFSRPVVFRAVEAWCEWGCGREELDQLVNKCRNGGGRPTFEGYPDIFQICCYSV
ncbi:hypothetical protein BSKO_02763 [Bryopsis sp. KO-2023]|nr:hypothetical protein BSKO_02763 [Bryopsis sp. KO-2023]